MTQSQPTYREEWNARRGIESSAAFFAPYISPGMNLLDAGCGPGSLTVDFAEAVAPGVVIGVDRDPRVVARARAAAEDRGVANAQFLVGNVYDLPFATGAFDAVWSSSIMQ